jgi:DNA-binding IclR family transcriptional regulator
MTDRVAVVRDGRILNIAESNRMTEYQLIGLASGVGVGEEIDEWMQLREIAHTYLQSLQDQIKATAQLAVLDRREMTLFYLDKVGHSSTAVALHSGASGPFDGTGLGKLLLAYEPLEQVKEWIEGEDFIQNPEHPVADPGTFLEEIQTVRQQGFSQELEENGTGILSVAAPVLDSQGKVIAGISVSVPVEQFPEGLTNNPLRTRVVEAAEAISREFIASRT